MLAAKTKVQCAEGLQAEEVKEVRTHCPSRSQPRIGCLYFPISESTVLRYADIFPQFWDLIKQSMLSEVCNGTPVLHKLNVKHLSNQFARSCMPTS